MNTETEIREPQYEYLWDGSLRETLSAIPVGLCPEVDACREVVGSKYECVVRFDQKRGCVPDNVFCNKKAIMWRSKKFSPVRFGKGVELIEGTPTDGGGSNNYPTPYFKEGYCILKFTTVGIPILSHYSYKWGISFLSINKITP